MKIPSSGFAYFYLIAAILVSGFGGGVQAAQFGAGWSLAGNGRNAVIDVPVVFGTKSAPVAGVSDAVTTIWKWDAVSQKWAFFTPSMDLDQVAAYAASKGYSVLKTIFPGEGFWVNASKLATVAYASAPAFVLSPWQLTGGWNLVATGANVTAPQFNAAITPFSATTLWAWNSSSANWYFYAPSLDASGGLSAYITSKSYLDFGSVTLGDGAGFWINRAVVQGSPTASLPPLTQAKQMFSELRTSFHAFHNSSNTGSLDDQVRRMQGDLNGVVVPNMLDVLRRIAALDNGTDLYRAVKLGQTAGYPVSTTPGIFGHATGNVYDVTTGSTTIGAYRKWQNDFHPIFPGAFGFSGITPQPGFGLLSCFTNNSVSTAGLSSVSCSVYGRDYPTQVNATTSTQQFVKLVITETAADQYGFTAEQWQRTNTSGTITSQKVGTATYTGTFSKTIATNGNVLGLAFAGDWPALSQGIAKITASVNTARSLQTAGTPYARYRYTAAGSIAGIDAAGVSLFSFGLDQGSYYDNLEDSLGSAAQTNSTKELNLVGVMQTKGTRFNGTLNAKAFTADADGLSYIPTDVSFTGSISDISPGGAGVILNVTVTGAVGNYAAYHAGQPLSASNYRHVSLALNGTLQLPSRPVMALTLSGAKSGPTTETLFGQYTYDNGLVITIAGTHNGSNSASDTLTFTNQDGIAVTLPATGNGVISKSGTTLGFIINGVIYYSDGSFESLN